MELMNGVLYGKKDSSLIDVSSSTPFRTLVLPLRDRKK